MKSMSKTSRKAKHLCGRSPKSRPEIITEWQKMEAEVFRDLPSTQNLENTAKESEIYPTTHEPQAIRIDAGCKQPIFTLLV